MGYISPDIANQPALQIQVGMLTIYSLGGGHGATSYTVYCVMNVRVTYNLLAQFRKISYLYRQIGNFSELC